MLFEKKVTELLATAGITVGGDEPHDIQVHDERFFGAVAKGGSLALGESYVAGWWDCQKLDEFFARLLLIDSVAGPLVPFNMPLLGFLPQVFNPQSMRKSRVVAEQHYDLSNQLFETMLGESMAYSCGYWRGASSLGQAQEQKLDLICKKLGLDTNPGMSVLDIGCGWGSLALHIGQNYGSRVTGATISQNQYEYARGLTAGLPNVRILQEDYRKLGGTLDRVVSVGMFEHVGSRNWREYMEVAYRCLPERDGLHLLHTIGRDSSHKIGGNDPWINKYIFPNGQLPSMAQIMKSAEGLFTVEDVHNFGSDYDLTLMAWYKNFCDEWVPQLDVEGKDKVFVRMWSYYLLSCAAAFRVRKFQLWQVVLSKNPTKEYVSVR